MNIQETQQAYEAWLQANPDFDEELLEKDEDGQYLDEDIKFSYQSFEAGTIAQEYISLNEIRAKQHEINELKAKLEQQPLWVSIDLLKPQYDTDVLVCFSDDDTPEIDRLISGVNFDYFAKNGLDVVCWMPLPKLPHEAQEQE